jgi:hypothetical protein
MQIKNEESTEEKELTVEKIETELEIDLDQYDYNSRGYIIHW